MTEQAADFHQQTHDEGTFREAIPMRVRRASSFTAYCRICATDQSLDAAAIESIHRSAEGLVGYVRCPGGHLVIHRFAEAYPKPDPPQSVIDLRNRLAGTEDITALREAGGF